MLRLLLVLAAALLAAGCDGTNLEAQRAFEDAALLSPVAGVTRTDDRGRVLSTDASDWQIAPAYLNNVAVLQLPFPNPVERGDVLRLTVDAFVRVPGGIRAFLLAEDAVSGRLDIQSIPDPGADCPNAARSGICQFALPATLLGRGGPGLYRVLLLDGNDGVVSYGDVDVR